MMASIATEKTYWDLVMLVFLTVIGIVASVVINTYMAGRRKRARDEAHENNVAMNMAKVAVMDATVDALLVAENDADFIVRYRRKIDDGVFGLRIDDGDEEFINLYRLHLSKADIRMATALRAYRQIGQKK